MEDNQAILDQEQERLIQLAEDRRHKKQVQQQAIARIALKKTEAAENLAKINRKIKNMKTVWRGFNVATGLSFVGLVVTWLSMSVQLWFLGVSKMPYNGLLPILNNRFNSSLSDAYGLHWLEALIVIFLWIVVIGIIGFIITLIYLIERSILV